MGGPGRGRPPPDLEDERIFLLCGFEPFDDCITEFDAGVPFWIGHGVVNLQGQGFNQKGVAPAVGHYDFKLYVNDQEIEKDWTFHGRTTTFNVFLFPEGLSGEVTFTGDWYGTCTFDDIGVIDGCDKPSDTWLFLSETLTINFS